LRKEEALVECPFCGSIYLEVYHEEYPDFEQMTQCVQCEDCSKAFAVFWKITEWQEIER